MIDWRNPFTPKDFKELSKAYDKDVTAEWAADLANAKFGKLIEQCPTMNLVHEFGQWSEQNYKFYLEPTHTARLICIERAKK